MPRRSERRASTRWLGAWGPVVAYVALIAFVSAQPRLRPPIEFTASDKVYHVLEYLVLGALLARALRASAGWSRAVVGLTAIVVGIVIGTSDELFQSTVPGRESSGLDLAADAVGVVIGQFAYVLGMRRRTRG